MWKYFLSEGIAFLNTYLVLLRQFMHGQVVAQRYFWFEVAVSIPPNKEGFENCMVIRQIYQFYEK